MGCGSSKDETSSGRDGGKGYHDALLPAALLPTTGPLSAKAYKQRLATSDGTRVRLLMA
jgi:hypothetical protein